MNDEDPAKFGEALQRAYDSLTPWQKLHWCLADLKQAYLDMISPLVMPLLEWLESQLQKLTKQ